MTICGSINRPSAQSIYPGQHAGWKMKVTTAPIQVESFDLKDAFITKPFSRQYDAWFCLGWLYSNQSFAITQVFATTPEHLLTWRWYDHKETRRRLGITDRELRDIQQGIYHQPMRSCTHLLEVKYSSWKVTMSCYRSGRSTGSFGKRVSQYYPEELINRNIRGTSVWAPGIHYMQVCFQIDRPIPHTDNKQYWSSCRMATGYNNLNRWTMNLREKDDKEINSAVNEFSIIFMPSPVTSVINGLLNLFSITMMLYIDPLKEQRDDLEPSTRIPFIPKVLAST